MSSTWSVVNPNGRVIKSRIADLKSASSYAQKRNDESKGGFKVRPVANFKG